MTFVRRMLGASAGAAGRSGYVPTPAAGDHTKFLRGDGTWQTPAGGGGGGDLLAANQLNEFDTLAKKRGARGNLQAAGIEEMNAQAIAAAGGALFDGVSGRGSAWLGGNNIGTGDFSIRIIARIPVTPPTVGGMLFLTGSSSGTASQPRSVRLWVLGSGSLQLEISGGTATDWRRATVAGFVTDYGGKVIDLVITRSGATLLVYINGATAAVTETTNGAAPAWSAPIQSTWLHLGATSATDFFNDRLARVTLFPSALSAGQIADLTFSGVGGSGRFRRKIIDPARNGIFADVATDWAAVGTGTPTLDAANDELDVACATASDGAKLAAAHLAQLTSGSLHRLDFELRGIAGLTVAVKWGDQVIASGLNTNKRYSIEFTPNTGVNDLQFLGSALGSFSVAGIALVDIAGAIQNGGFERSGAGADPFAFWQRFQAGSSTVTRDATEAYSGTASCKFTVDGSNNAAQLEYSNILTVGRRYRLTLAAKVNDLAGGPVLNIGNANVAAQALSSTDWTQYTFDFVATETVLVIKRGNNCSNKSIWLDNIELEDLGAVIDLSPWGLDPATTLWRDASVNNLHATLLGGTRVLAGYGGKFSQVDVLGQESERKASRRGALVFDGLTSGAKVTSVLTGQNSGAGDFALWVRFRVPPANPSSVAGIVTLSPDASGAVGGSVALDITTGGDLRFMFFGATTADQRNLRYTGLVAHYGGKVIDVFVSRSGSRVKLLIQRAEVAAIEQTAGTPPGFADSLTTTYLHLGIEASSARFTGDLYQAVLFNGALWQSDVDEIATQGIPERLKWGNVAARYTSDFAAGADSWLAISTSAVTGNTDGIGGEDDTLLIDSAAGTVAIGGRAFAVTVGKRVRLTARVYRPSANVTGVRFGFRGGSGTTPFGHNSESIPADSWTTITGEFEATLATTIIGACLLNAASSTTVTAGDRIYIKDVQFDIVGAVLDLACDIGYGYKLPDRSANKLTATIAPKGVTHKIEAENLPWIVEEFLGGGTSSGSIGDLGWNFTGGSYTRQTHASDDGLIRQNTGTSISTVAALHLGSASDNFARIDTRPWRARWRFVAIHVTQVQRRIGWTSDVTGDPPSDGVYFENTSAGAAGNWFAKVRASNSDPAGGSVDLGIVLDTNPHWFEIRGNGAGVYQFFYDDILVATLTPASSPSVGVRPIFQTKNTEASGKYTDIMAYRYLPL